MMLTRSFSTAAVTMGKFGKRLGIAAAGAALLLLTGCAGPAYLNGDYGAYSGPYYDNGYPGPYDGPYYGDYGPYDAVVVGGGYYGGHHFYGRSFGHGGSHGGGGFHGGGGGFRGGGHSGGGRR